MSEELVRDLGVIIFPSDVSVRGIDRVIEAAAQAGISDKFVHEIKPRNCFIRAIRQLKKDGVIAENDSDDMLVHKFQDTDDVIEFQFSRCYLQSQGVDYSKAAVVSFNKHSHQITCANESVSDLALKLYRQSESVYTTQDIQALVKRVIVKAGAKRIPLRDGVYFVPLSYKHVADQIKKFFETLGFSFFIMPVGCSSGEKDNLIKSTVRDMVNLVNGIQDEIRKLKEKGELTERVAKSRLKELQNELKSYREVARCLQTESGRLFDKAENAGIALLQVDSDNLDDMIGFIARGGRVAPLVADLMEVIEPAKIAGLKKQEARAVDMVPVSGE
jgi:hypothetical protein